MDPTPVSSRNLLPSGEARARLRRWRKLKDHVSRYLIGCAGVGVVVALATIFVYLFSEVMPMLRPTSVEPVEAYAAPGGGGGTVFIATERYREVGVRFTRDARAIFFAVDGGAVRAEHELPVPAGVTVTSFAAAEPRTGLVAYGLSDGTALVVRHEYDLDFPDDVRVVEPKLEFPLGRAPVRVADDGTALATIAVQQGPRGIAVAAATGAGGLLLASFEQNTSFLSGDIEVVRSLDVLPEPEVDVDHLLVDTRLRSLFAAGTDGRVSYYDIATPADATLRETRRILHDRSARLTALEFLLGSVSLIAGGSDGSVNQWMLVRDADNLYHVTHVRGFDRHDAPVVAIRPEYSRKGFATTDAAGGLAIHYATAAQTVYAGRVSDGPVTSIAIAPRDDALLYSGTDGVVHRADLWNRHPEVSFSAFWHEVWYEGRDGPDYVWQASSATDEFERKFSLVPLSIGTIKAAFYAMLFAMPLAIFGAIYSAYFMTPKLRRVVKPTIEVMEALPTVILGFLAGLWLAPFVEGNLPAMFSILLLMPVMILAFAWVWTHLPRRVRFVVPPGWEAALLVVPIVSFAWASIALSPVIETAFFGGDMRQWFTDVGITYDQRNALVVGIAMGFAVIPTIFSIAEDAIFTVPKHLTQGSLALGATPWQTVTRVVLLTASPGIFSAVMIGLGRAVGETMIVLMATGNSPIVNFNIFEGMRTLSANIAVELPETAVGGTHYRILFLAALLLFAITFVLNTVAELVRQRLRTKYSQL